MAERSYRSMNITALKKELRKRGAKINGLIIKEQLIQKLQDYDRKNDLVGNVEHELPQKDLMYTVEWPTDNLYRSVTSKSVSPELDIVHISMYFLEVYKENPGMNEYVHRKGYNMMINEYLVALESCTQKNLYFYKGKVKSENTKALLYFISIAFKLDGQIVQSMCGCTAAKELKGVCKHIACVCYAILKFKEHSVWQMKKTPIENKHKSHKLENININSSSKTAENFNFEIDKYHTTKRKRNMCFDPRPDNTSSSQQWNDHSFPEEAHFMKRQTRQLLQTNLANE